MVAEMSVRSRWTAYLISLPPRFYRGMVIRSRIFKILDLIDAPFLTQNVVTLFSKYDLRSYSHIWTL